MIYSLKKRIKKGAIPHQNLTPKKLNKHYKKETLINKYVCGAAFYLFAVASKIVSLAKWPKIYQVPKHSVEK